jgi:peptidoglycan/LPS O-acetylase OafA/YrhL
MLGIARERGNPRCFRAAIFVILRNSIQVLRRVLDQVFVTQQIGITRFDNWLLGEYRPPLWSFATFTQSLPIAFAATDEGPRWMAMTWSLAMEEQFYLLFPLAVYFLPRRGTTLR